MYNKNNNAMLISCIALAMFGGSLGYLTKPTMKASESPPVVTQYISKADLPLDLQLDLAKTEPKDSVPNFTIEVKSQKPKEKVVYKYKTRKVRVPVEPDTLPVVPANISLATPEVREEKTSDTIGHSKSSIILIVDDEEVYKR